MVTGEPQRKALRPQCCLLCHWCPDGAIPSNSAVDWDQASNIQPNCTIAFPDMWVECGSGAGS